MQVWVDERYGKNLDMARLATNEKLLRYVAIPQGLVIVPEGLVEFNPTRACGW